LTVYQIMFYLIAAFILITGLLSVISKKVFRSAIFLLFSLLGISGLYFWMEMEFIAAVQISVYVGGIVVLIIFSIFLTEQAGKETKHAPAVRTVSAILAALFGIIQTGLIIYRYQFSKSEAPLDFSVTRIGKAMLNFGADGFSLPFEAVSILLLAAMVGCIVVAMKSNIIIRNQDSNQTNSI